MNVLHFRCFYSQKSQGAEARRAKLSACSVCVCLCVVFFPRDEGGQGLVHPACRTATLRLQFAHRFLTGPPDLVWRKVASCRTWAALVLTDFYRFFSTMFGRLSKHSAGKYTTECTPLCSPLVSAPAKVAVLPRFPISVGGPTESGMRASLFCRLRSEKLHKNHPRRF